MNMDKPAYIACYRQGVFHSLLNFIPGNPKTYTYAGICFVRGGPMAICKADWLGSISNKTKIKKDHLTIKVIEKTTENNDIHFTAIEERAKKGVL